jgi:hypothetical protein
MVYDPEKAKVNLAAQLIVYHGHELDEIGAITGITEAHLDALEVEIERLRDKASKATTQYHPKFSTDEIKVRKLRGFST